MKTRLFYILTAAFFVLQSGCSHEIVKNISADQAKQVISRLSQARAGIKSIHIRTRAALYSHGKARKGRMDLFAKGGNLRSEVWSPTDNLLDLTVVCDKRFVHVNLMKSTCEIGPTRSLNFLPISLPYPDIQAVLAGLGPDPKDAVVYSIGDEFLLKSPKNEYKIKAGLGPLRVTYYELLMKGTHYKVRQKRFKRVDGLDGMAIPHWIRIEFKGNLIQLKYKSVEINPKLGDDVFKCECPANFKVRRLK